MDLHRRRSVLVRMTPDGRRLDTAQITNSPEELRREIARAGEHPKVVLEATYGWYQAADTLADEKKSLQTGPTDIYIVRVKLNSEETKTIPGFSPTPGMPAEVYIKTADRTFFQYIVKPIQDSMSRAFRER